jgi:hypothetical protein
MSEENRDFDLEVEIARSLKALEELEKEDERNGVNEALRQLLEEQKRRWDEYFKEQDAEAAKYIAERGGA